MIKVMLLTIVLHSDFLYGDDSCRYKNQIVNYKFIPAKFIFHDAKSHFSIMLH